MGAICSLSPCACVQLGRRGGGRGPFGGARVAAAADRLSVAACGFVAGHHGRVAVRVAGGGAWRREPLALRCLAGLGRLGFAPDVLLRVGAPDRILPCGSKGIGAKLENRLHVYMEATIGY